MRTVVCDASPLIVLAKLDRLHLIQDVLRSDIVVLRGVVDQMLVERADSVHLARLERFVRLVRVVDGNAQDDGVRTGALSRADRATLAWAVENRPDWLVADERLLRRAAQAHGIAVVGVVGILVSAARSGMLTRKAARATLDDAIARHGLRLSIALYQRIAAELRIEPDGHGR